MSARKRAEPSSDDDEEVVLSDDEDVPVARRQRLAPDFPRGAVLKVRMVNFMTYTDVTVEPGPRLNLILGPNGTGKSSMVCAICIGLAGSTKLLGRAKEVKEYVKRGEASATVVVTLSSGNPAKPTVVTRKITTDNKSEWKLNGAAVPQAKIVEAVAALNIQLDNLCQFLPQDRVVAFAQMTPCELLLETEKAFGARELFEQHTRLIEDKQGMKELETDVASTAANLERLKSINAGLERDVERFNARAALLEKVEAMNAKLPWVHYEAARAAHETAKEDTATAKKIVAEKEAALNKYSAPLKAKNAALAEVEEKVNDAVKRIKALDAQTNATEETFEREVAEVDGRKSDIASLKRKIATRATRLAKQEADIATLQKELDEVPSSAGRGAELEDIKARWRAENAELRKLEDEVAEMSEQLRLPQQEAQFLSNKLKQMADERSTRIETLITARRAPNRCLLQAVETVARLKQQGSFKREVFGPLLCEVQPRDRQICNYLESQCQAWMWSMFITQCDEDRDLLEQRTAGLNVSIVNYPKDPEAREAPKASLQTLAQWGVTSTLDDTFDAPPVVKAVLRDQCGTARAYVGSDQSDKYVDQILAAGAPILWTPTNQYVAAGSKYNAAARYTRMVPTRPARLFTSRGSSATTAELTAKLKACQAKVAERQAAGTKAERARDEVQQRVEELQKRREGLQREEQKLERRRKELQKTIAAKTTSLEAERRASDGTSDIAKLEAEVATHQKRAVAAALKGSAALADLAAMLMERAPLALAAAELKEEARVLRVRLDSQSAELAAAKKAAANAADAANTFKAKAKALYAAAEAKAKLTPELSELFQTLPDAADELEDLIASTAAEADGIMCANPGVMQDYKNRCIEIAAQEKAHAAKSAELATHQAQLDAIRAAWLPKLRELFGKVSTAFAAAFAGIGCAGEVKLTEAGDDFAAYSVNIMVKFRANEQMRQLTASYQSGGERSVSTMLYLIALQDLTRCPFRVVDEINQGMDPKNERKIFQQMVASACAPGTPQCFLLTPKLLPQLTYSPEVSILCIFNGPWARDVCVNWRNDLMLGAPTSTEVC